MVGIVEFLMTLQPPTQMKKATTPQFTGEARSFLHHSENRSDGSRQRADDSRHSRHKVKGLLDHAAQVVMLLPFQLWGAVRLIRLVVNRKAEKAPSGKIDNCLDDPFAFTELYPCDLPKGVKLQRLFKKAFNPSRGTTLLYPPTALPTR